MDRDVLIAGAGIAGRALARALRREGIASLTLERGSGPGYAGLALNLPGNAIAALDVLGLGDEVRRVAHPVRRREYRNHRGRLLFRIDEVRFWGDRLQPRCVRRSDLMALLGSGSPVDAVAPGSAITHVHQDADGVSVQMADGSSACGRFLVGADGVHSTVRGSLARHASAVTAQLSSASWRFMAPNTGIDCWTLWAGADGMVLLVPVDGDTVYGWATASRGRLVGEDPNALRDLFANHPALVRTALDAALSREGGIHCSPLDEVRAPSWGLGRVVLIGDAAHATAPVWAQGAALAMEDAIVLAELLARGGSWAGVATAYEELRRPRVRHVQSMTDRMSRTARLPAALRNLVLPLLGPKTYAATYAPLRTWPDVRR